MHACDCHACYIERNQLCTSHTKHGQIRLCCLGSTIPDIVSVQARCITRDAHEITQLRTVPASAPKICEFWRDRPTILPSDVALPAGQLPLPAMCPIIAGNPILLQSGLYPFMQVHCPYCPGAYISTLLVQPSYVSQLQTSSTLLDSKQSSSWHHGRPVKHYVACVILAGLSAARSLCTSCMCALQLKPRFCPVTRAHACAAATTHACCSSRCTHIVSAGSSEAPLAERSCDSGDALSTFMALLSGSSMLRRTRLPVPAPCVRTVNRLHGHWQVRHNVKIC